MPDHGTTSDVPLIAHVIHRLQTGGLENGLVNLINNMPNGRYRHAIICMTEYTDFRERLHGNIPCYALHKKSGKDPAAYFRFWKLVRELKPDLLHTRNIGTLECVLPAMLAGVPARVHGEHGRDISDLHGCNRKHNLLRRLLSPMVGKFIALSKDLEQWLVKDVGLPQHKIVQVYNGVDTDRFSPVAADAVTNNGKDTAAAEIFTIGCVGRMQAEKDPLNLARAFIQLADILAEGSQRLRLVMIGDGPLRKEVTGMLQAAGHAEQVWCPGDRDDVAELYHSFDVFALPSLAEGISNTILEAMASGLPVVATDVGGNAELLQAGQTGLLVPPDDPGALAAAIGQYFRDREMLQAHGLAGRRRAEDKFGIRRMVERYLEVYDRALET